MPTNSTASTHRKDCGTKVPSFHLFSEDTRVPVIQQSYSDTQSRADTSFLRPYHSWDMTKSFSNPTPAPPLAQHTKPADSQDLSTMFGHLHQQVANQVLLLLRPPEVLDCQELIPDISPCQVFQWYSNTTMLLEEWGI